MKEHGYLLFYPPELVMANVKLQAARKLGRSFAALLAATEGYYRLGYLDEEGYLKLKERYTAPLIQEKKKPPTLRELKKREELNRLQRHYSEVLKQWPTLREEVRKAHIKKARKLADKVPNAHLILALANDEPVSFKTAKTERALNG